jgi:hypothetical protein
MTIPSDILYTCKDLLRLPVNNTEWDIKLQDVYSDELRVLLQTTDWFMEVEFPNTVANQRRYVAQPRMRRIVSVMYGSKHLGKVTGASLDLLRRKWQAQGTGTVDEPGTPQVWWHDETPDPTVTPQVFFIHPAPATSVANGLTLYEICSPEDENPSMQWVRPLLVYLTCAGFREGAHTARDAQQAAFFRALSQLWKDVIDKRMPR